MPINSPHLCIAQKELFLCTGNANITQAAFFFHFFLIHQRPRTWENTFLHAGQKDDREFQTLRRMQCHQRNSVLTQLGIVNIRHQRHMPQEIFQIILFFRLGKFLPDRHQFHQVVNAALRLRCMLIPQFFHITGLIQHLFDQFLYRQVISLIHQIKNDSRQFIQLADETDAQSFDLRGIRYHVKQRHPIFSGMGLQLGQRCIADTAARHIDDPQQTQRICRVKNNSQISDDILDLLTVVEFKSPDHIIGDPAFDKHFLKNTRLRIRAVQDCHLAQLHILLPLQLLQFFDHKTGLVAFVDSLKISDRHTIIIIRPQIFRFAACIIFNNSISGIQNNLRTAVILFQLDDFGFGIILFKIQNVLDISTAPAVNALVGIAHDTDITMSGRQKLG